jgi:putative SOS response-associated peptidase YedK
MCGRYGQFSSRDVLHRYFHFDTKNAPPDIYRSYNVGPQSFQPVIRLSRDGKRELCLMRWGLIPHWAKDPKIGFSTFNARAEDICKKPAFRDAIKHRRCLIPADVFYEWKKISTKEKQPYAIGMTDGTPFAFAGVWESWNHEGHALDTFSIITTEPNDLLKSVHNRMPVILAPEDYDRWLAPGDPTHLPIDLLKPLPAERMRMWPIHKHIGNVQNDGVELIQPLT